MKIPRFIKVSCFLAIIILVVLILIPVPKPTEANTYDVHDNITNVEQGISNDIVFHLNKISKKPYINRGLEKGLSIEELNKKLVGKKVHLKFVDHWTPLDFNKSNPTLAYIKLTETGEVLYNNITPS